MTLTVEPGCYVRPGEGVPERFWNIGVRIEDDALVTATGCEILTRAAPKRVDEIEALMRDARVPLSEVARQSAAENFPRKRRAKRTAARVSPRQRGGE
jgi:hypothetical protein